MGSSGGGTPEHTSTRVRYAQYIEDKHSNFLATIQSARIAVINDSPFIDYTDIEVDDAFFGAGYTIASFPSLYDMYGKFMAGLDVEALWSQIFEGTVNPSVVEDLVAAEGDLIDDEIETTSVPRLQTGMRDINSVMSSSFVVGKSIIEDSRTKLVAKFSADLKYHLIPIAQARWEAHLNWNKLVITTYAEIMKLYYLTKTDINEINYAMTSKDRLWPFTVLDFERAALGALQGATNQKTDVAGASTAAKVLAGAMSGAALGASVGGQISASGGGTYAGTGSLVGAGLGAAAAYYY